MKHLEEITEEEYLDYLVWDDDRGNMLKEAIEDE